PRPPLQFPPRDRFDDCDAFDAVVKTRYRGEALAARLAKVAGVLDADFLQRLQAVGGESRSDDDPPFAPARGELAHRRGGIGLQPFGAAEARLKGHLEALPVQLESL